MNKVAGWDAVDSVFATIGDAWHTVRTCAETHGVPMDAPERLARRRDACLGGPARIEPDALYAEDGAVGARTGVFARTGGDQRRKPAKAVANAVAMLG